MKVSITGARSELGGILARMRGPGGTENLHINVAGQQANTLLHDGHAWKDFARIAFAGTRRATRTARADRAPMLVHASFAFVHAIDRGTRLPEPLRSAVDAILECEAHALSGPVPACVVRLGYLYGPESADLRSYRTAFRLGRPYWSGSPKVLQYHVHQFDAAAALLAAARPRNEGKILYATDAHPVSFRRLMDAFAHSGGPANSAASALVLEAPSEGHHSPSVSAGVILTHFVEVKLTHLGEYCGFWAAEDAYPGASSGNQSNGPKGRRSSTDRAGARLFSEHGQALLARRAGVAVWTAPTTDHQA